MSSIKTTISVKHLASGIPSAICQLDIYPGFSGIISDIVTFVYEAKKWGEYADANGDPAWDTLTGLAINKGSVG